MILDGSIHSWDERRDIIALSTEEEAVAFAAEHWIHTAQRAIQQKGHFFVALSGGSTPQKIYAQIVSRYKDAIDWTKVHLFWSDERDVPLNHTESNYYMAMESGFKTLPIPPNQIHPMRTKADTVASAADYEDLLHRILGPSPFDLVMLGIGEDGHTASLFPHSLALQEEEKWVVSNTIPTTEKKRITFSFKAIHHSARIEILVIGQSKQAIVPLVLNSAIRSPFPASAIGTNEVKALWILDRAAAHLLSDSERS